MPKKNVKPHSQKKNFAANQIWKEGKKLRNSEGGYYPSKKS